MSGKKSNGSNGSTSGARHFSPSLCVEKFYDVIYGDDGDVDQKKTKSLTVLRAYPPDLHRKARSLGGSLHGVWAFTNPLQLHPSSHFDAKITIQESNLSDNKKLEWELDLLREYDERRMDRLEAFLVSRRDGSTDIQLKSSVKKLGNQPTGAQKRREEERIYKYEYYRDRGRQPNRL